MDTKNRPAVTPIEIKKIPSDKQIPREKIEIGEEIGAGILSFLKSKKKELATAIQFKPLLKKFLYSLDQWAYWNVFYIAFKCDRSRNKFERQSKLWDRLSLSGKPIYTNIVFSLCKATYLLYQSKNFQFSTISDEKISLVYIPNMGSVKSDSRFHLLTEKHERILKKLLNHYNGLKTTAVHTRVLRKYKIQAPAECVKTFWFTPIQHMVELYIFSQPEDITGTKLYLWLDYVNHTQQIFSSQIVLVDCTPPQLKQFLQARKVFPLSLF